jgi:phosphatidylinositol alpha-mannosyltransferase
LLVVGAFDKEDKEKYVLYARQHGLRDVKFIGYVSAEELVRYYHTAHVFCAPSTGFESFGMILVEAMASGVPIVASDIAGYQHVVTHERDGLLAPPCDEKAIANALVRVLQDDGLRARLAAQGRQTAEQYSWPRVAQQTLDLYEQCREAHATKRREPARFSMTDLKLKERLSTSMRLRSS